VGTGAAQAPARPGRHARWIELTLGLLLVVVSTSGALIVYEPELLRASNAELFHTTLDTALDDAPAGLSAAMDAVTGADPEFSAADASLKDGVYLVSSADGDGQIYFVDAGSGVVNGQNNLYGGVVGFLENLHDCALTCEEFAGYVPWLAGPSPLAGSAQVAQRLSAPLASGALRPGFRPAQCHRHHRRGTSADLGPDRAEVRGTRFRRFLVFGDGWRGTSGGQLHDAAIGESGSAGES
jgi:hypothetical protein